MKTFIAIPCHDMIDTGFVQSLEALQRPGLCSVNFLAGSLVYDARNKLAMKAMECGSDYVLWLDSDMVFNKDLLIRMIAHMENGKDFVSGLCFRRQPPYTPCIYSKARVGLTAADNESEQFDAYPRSKVFQIEACGFAAVMVKTERLKQVAERYGTIFAPMNGYGEDISACLRLRNVGTTLWCDSSVKLGHLGKVVIDEDAFDAFTENTKR